MAKIMGLDKMRLKLKEVALKFAGKGELVEVGYSASYAIYVHENLFMNHPNGGQAKFLEQPAREMQKDLTDVIIVNLVKRGKTMLQARILAAGRLKRASQKLCPVDTGFLRDSAYVKADGIVVG